MLFLNLRIFLQYLYQCIGFLIECSNIYIIYIDTTRLLSILNTPPYHPRPLDGQYPPPPPPANRPGLYYENTGTHQMRGPFSRWPYTVYSPRSVVLPTTCCRAQTGIGLGPGNWVGRGEGGGGGGGYSLKGFVKLTFGIQGLDYHFPCLILGHPKIIICFLFTARVGYKGPTGTLFFMFLEKKKILISFCTS